jgi:hypothetical protein
MSTDIDKALSSVPPIGDAELARRNAKAVELLRSWVTEGDETEQRETLEVLRKALGPDRLMAHRSVFR